RGNFTAAITAGGVRDNDFVEAGNLPKPAKAVFKRLRVVPAGNDDAERRRVRGFQRGDFFVSSVAASSSLNRSLPVKLARPCFEILSSSGSMDSITSSCRGFSL